jgi:DNA-directed RNA polymerase specialized sigma24 family protein
MNLKRPSREELIQLYSEERSAMGIARKLQVNESTVHRWLNHYGLRVERQLKRKRKGG